MSIRSCKEKIFILNDEGELSLCQIEKNSSKSLYISISKKCQGVAKVDYSTKNVLTTLYDFHFTSSIEIGNLVNCVNKFSKGIYASPKLCELIITLHISRYIY